MSFEFHALQLVPLFLFGLYCLKRFVDMERLHELKVVVLSAILIVFVLVLFAKAINEMGGGYQLCAIDFNESEKDNGDKAQQICIEEVY